MKMRKHLNENYNCASARLGMRLLSYIQINEGSADSIYMHAQSHGSVLVHVLGHKPDAIGTSGVPVSLGGQSPACTCLAA